MQRRVSYFDVGWSRREQTGRIRVTFDDREFVDLGPLTAEETTVLCEVLRQGKVVYYDPDTETLSTLADPVHDTED
ncbi:MAG: hypothetical protein ACR2P8_02190 [Myxococcota bacterium]